MNKLRMAEKLSYWLLVAVTQAFILWLCYMMIFNSVSMPRSAWEAIRGGGLLDVVAIVVVSVIIYAMRAFVRTIRQVDYKVGDHR